MALSDIERFFREHMDRSPFMPSMFDLDQWLQRRAMELREEREDREWQEAKRRHEDWKNSPTYEADLKELDEHKQRVMERVSKAQKDRELAEAKQFAEKAEAHHQKVEYLKKQGLM